VAYLGAGIAWTLAALPDAEAPRLLAVARAGAGERAARAGLAAELETDPYDAALRRREAQAITRGTLESLAALWPSLEPAVRKELGAPTDPPPAAPEGRDPRVPIRDPGVRGPIDVYYYDHLAETLGAGVDTGTALTARADGDRLAWEALNLVDGKRTVAEIRDLLAGRYEPVPMAEVSQYLDLLSRARVVRWKAQ
jgi:hypothetical protein